MLMKMILSHKQNNRALPPVDSGSSMRLSELENMMNDRVNQAVEPLVARIDELESFQLLAASEKMLIEEGEETSSTAPTRERS